MPYTDRIDYLGAMFMNHAYAMAVERLHGIEVPPRAEYLRVLADELNRIASHLICLGSVTMDLGAYTPFLNAVREREVINDILETLCGARLTYNYCRVGGVSFDLPPGLRERILTWLDGFEVFLDEFDRLITYNEIFLRRCKDVGVVTADEAIGWGLVGPNLRASGVDSDLRRDLPYSIYKDLSFDVVVGHGKVGTVGDVFDRFWCRIEEIKQSCGIVRQALTGMPLGPILGKVPKKLKAEKGADAHVRIESARGDTLVYAVSDGSEKPYRLRFRTGSFTALSIMAHKGAGMMVADLVALFASLDVIAPETDR
jgi:NADH-quinone oxidoreductase subunit D